MGQILLLTRNVLNEQPFETKIRQLGHEIYTSEVMLNTFLVDTSNTSMVKNFHHIILSETITNIEVQALVKNLNGMGFCILRKSDMEVTETQLEEWNNQGIAHWISTDPELEMLREFLSCQPGFSKQVDPAFPQSSERKSLADLSLSNGELKLFLLLYDHYKEVLSREEICLYMWGGRKSKSNLSQLSLMVKHLKNKLTDQHIVGPIIQTFWGRGYQLDEAVYEQVYVNYQLSKNA